VKVHLGEVGVPLHKLDPQEIVEPGESEKSQVIW
jgi:hypothetical protein